MTDIKKATNSINIKTIHGQSYTFGMLFSPHQTYALIEQLNKIAMKNIIQDPDTPTYEEQAEDQQLLGKLTSQASVKKTFLLRDLTKRQQSDEFRRYFRLPQRETLDGRIKASIWLPYTKRNATGNIYLSQNFMCFKSDVKDLVSLVIPLKLIQVRKPQFKHLTSTKNKLTQFDSQSVEKKTDSASKFENQILVLAENSAFLFSHILERDLFLSKISFLLSQFMT